MKIDWNINEDDIRKIADFVNQQSGEYIANRIARNINYQGLLINRDTILYSLLHSLLLSSLKPDNYLHIDSITTSARYNFQYLTIKDIQDIKSYASETLKNHGLALDLKKMPEYFAYNFDLLESSNWELVDRLIRKLCIKESKKAEREIADYIDTMFKGFDACEARVFLQTLGLTKFEIPIDLTVSDWLNDFGFPVKLSPLALQDRDFYHFVSDGVQLLCKRAEVYPCVLEAAIHAVNFRKQFEVM